MSDINKHITIPKNVASEDDQDFAFLRKIGIEHIERIGGKLWTDFNSHDPGITILEMLSYAITDLGMRIDMPIEDILTNPQNTPGLDNQFYRASEVFPTKAVTALDYRKIFIDIDGVNNCWLSKFDKTVYVNCKDDILSYNANEFDDVLPDHKTDFQLNGLYNLLVDFDELDDQLTDSQKETIIQNLTDTIRAKYHDNRNLCEDLIHINEIETQPISICANIEVENHADEEWIQAQVLTAIQEYFSPSVRFYSITEMLDKGFTTDQIFEGPILNHGFIIDKDLIKADLRKEVRLTDIIRIIMGIEGVKLIQNITIVNCDEENDGKEKWVICVDPLKRPELCDKSVFNYHKGVLPLNMNQDQVAIFLTEIEEDKQDKANKAMMDRVLSLPSGEYLNPGSYTTIQNDFPDTYGIGQEGIFGKISVERKSKAKQLKAYLLFFDQILASYFQHLGKVKDLLSINGTEQHSFFTQVVQDIKGFDELVNDYPTNATTPTPNIDLTDKLFNTLDNNIERRNQILDHLLSRFAEKFSEYTFLMKALYGQTSDEIVLQNKERFLSDYVASSSQKACAFNYYHRPASDLWDTNNISGLQKRVSRLLGINNYKRRNLTEMNVEIYQIAGSTDYGWRVKDNSNNIILSTTESYANITEAKNEFYLSVFNIIATSENDIIEAFENPFIDLMIVGNIQIHQSGSSQFSFHIVNLDFPPSSSDFIISKQWTYHDTLQETKEAILHLIRFMKHEFSEEGMFLVEHILLRPNVLLPSDADSKFLPICTDNCTSCDPIDPYSFRVSIVIPGYTYRFADPDFRRYMENVIKEEMPSHILPKICWVGYRKNEVPDDQNDLLCFENAYKDYLIKKTPLEQEQPNPETEELINALSKLSTIFPSGRLLDCDDDDDELEGKIILGRTNLGSL